MHNHQPAGNFGWVLEETYERSYLPLVECLERHPRIRLALHYTGYLLDHLQQHHPDFIERVRALVTKGQVEVMGGGSFDRISIAAMLIPTNDAFFGVVLHHHCLVLLIMALLVYGHLQLLIPQLLVPLLIHLRRLRGSVLLMLPWIL